MEYFFKSSAVIFIFLILYKLFLQRETFFRTNRFYLLAGLLVAAFIPFILIPVYIEYMPTTIENTIPISSNIETSQTSNETSFDLWQLLFSVYCIGVIFFLGKLIIELTSLKFLFNKHQYYKNGSFIFVETNDEIPPFSFFNWIVYNPKKYSTEELNHILNHEKAHAKELHSIDIILTQFACVLLWFNPFVWLYKKEIQQNLEFIADKKAQDYSECEKSYQLILLKSSTPKHKFLITNNFYNSQIKKRIIMLHKSKSNKLNAWKYGLILPVLALFLMSFNTKEIFIEIENPSDNDDLVQTEASAYLNTIYDNIAVENETESKPLKNSTPITNKTSKTDNTNANIIGDISVTVITKNTTDFELDEIKENLKKQGLTVKFRGVKRNSKGQITAIKIDAKSDKSSASYNVSSNDAIAPVKIIYDESKNSISIGNGHSIHGENTFVFESKDGNHQIHKSGSKNHVLVITDEDEKHEHDSEHEHEHDAKIIIKHDGKKGKVKRIKRTKHVEVITGDDDNEVIEIIIDEDVHGEHDVEKETIIVNGKKINVVKGKAKGKSIWVSDDGNEEDIIILKNSDKKGNIFISGDDNKNPLFIIDGKEVSKDALVDLKPDAIESVNVLKGEKALEKYGEKGKDGVIIIKTKKKN